MIGVIATITVKDGSEAAFEAAFAKMIAAVKAIEPGNHMYALWKPQDGSNDYRVVEIYEDAAALETHGKSDHYREGGRSLRDLVAAPPKVERFDPVA